MRKINRDSPLIFDKEEGYKVDTRGPQQKKADAERAKKDAAKKKESDKTYKEALKKHREIQSKDVQERMDYHLAVTNKENSKEKECFLKRWFRPSTDVDKVEKRRAKEDAKRMAATRKKADQNNEDRTSSSFKGKKRQSKGKADPADYEMKSGYKEGKKGETSSDYKQTKSSDTTPKGGGGSYKSGATGGAENYKSNRGKSSNTPSRWRDKDK
jgi:hypothetical protein